MLNAAIWNANGIISKKNELRFYLSNEKIDLIIISETKLKPNVAFKIPNYLVYRKDREINRGGGVLSL